MSPACILSYGYSLCVYVCLTTLQIEDLDRYLESMGVSSAEARARLTKALPWQHGQSLAGAQADDGTGGVRLPAPPSTLIVPANKAAETVHTQVTEARAGASKRRQGRAAAKAQPYTPYQATDHTTAALFIVLDSRSSVSEVQAWAQQLSRPCFYLLLPPFWHFSQLADVPAVARLLHVALRTVVPKGPYVLGGLGHGAVLAHELAVQVTQSGDEVSSLLLIESAALRAAWELCSQPWVQCYHFVSAWHPDMDMAGEFAGVGRTLAGRGLHASQCDYMRSLCPPGHSRATWEAALEQRIRAASARCSGARAAEQGVGESSTQACRHTCMPGVAAMRLRKYLHIQCMCKV